MLVEREVPESPPLFFRLDLIVLVLKISMNPTKKGITSSPEKDVLIKPLPSLD